MHRLLACALLLLAPLAHAVDPTFDRAWIREAPPGATALAGFLSIEGGSRNLELTGASSPDFARIEIHESSIDGDGMMKMRALDTLEIPAGARLTLAPGGEHLMLFEPRRPLAVGDKVTITLNLKRSDPVEVEFEVRAAQPGAAPPAGH